MSACHGCGAKLPPLKAQGRPRKWCSERCRKASYGDPCVDCGASTVYGAERARVPEPRCASCRVALDHARRVDLVLAMLRLRRAHDLTNLEIARHLSIPVLTVATELSRMRALGFDFPAAPYNNAAANRATRPVITRDAECLGRALQACGVSVPAFDAAVAA